jgi:hypothetical protein
LPVVLARKPKLLFGWWFACTIEDAMKILSTLAFSVVLGFAIVGASVINCWWAHVNLLDCNMLAPNLV